ncbi:MAG: cyclic pyranopterin monophosphate synthase MoaC [Gammaproteobacteria bacterium]|nr:cyclic pyranopterin monophosphate synthase MoaC [Gammaproteobacteria bacterium]
MPGVYGLPEVYYLPAYVITGNLQERGTANGGTVAISHIDEHNKPTMVDVSGKDNTRRSARAETYVSFPPEVYAQLQAAGMQGKKGPIIDTAIIAGVMAAKRTHDLIPFCHPLPIECCNINIDEVPERTALRITAHVRVTHKTGVEMEALTAATMAALTIYDMCKALTHDIVIGDTRLLSKRGGKSAVGQP